MMRSAACFGLAARARGLSLAALFLPGLLFALLFMGCPDDDPSLMSDAGSGDLRTDRAADADVTIRCGQGTSGTLAPGGTLAVSDSAGLDLVGAAVSSPSTAASMSVTLSCEQDLVPTGYLALGPAVAFGPAGTLSTAALRFTLPYKPARLPSKAQPGSIVVFFRPKNGASSPRLLPLLNPTTDAQKGRISFQLDELGTFQAAISKKAGTSIKRRFTYRGIVGFSMGGGAAAVIGLKNPDLFDFIGPLGGEPGANLMYFLSMLEDTFLSGFCTDADEKAGTGKIGQLCPLKRKARSAEHELVMSFEKMLYQEGQGVGLTLNRGLYMRGMRDILRAYGNPMFHNAKDPYLPPGVPSTHLDEGSAVCGKPHILKGFYDREYNPNGTHPVITFCDSTDSGTLGVGVFDPSLKQTTPAQILLAVDLNANGERDTGEPVVLHSHEPFRDVGTDGQASTEEAGYDAVKNPDPTGDDFHYLKNPGGKEGNFRYDVGEPYDDLGVDGVKGTCQASTGTATCWDYGEGNKAFDYSPMVASWLKQDPYTLYEKLSAEKRQRLDIWADAGIRDFLNSHVATNGLMGQIAAMGEPVRIYEDFKLLMTDPTFKYYDFARVDYLAAGKNAYVRYGDPTMDAKLVENTGDGRHVGTAEQVVNRTISFFAMAQKRWPGGDRETQNAPVGSLNFKKDETFKSPSTGQDRPFALFLPPGYFESVNQAKRYPVIYFLHGYGQQPDELITLSTVFANYMVSKTIEESARFQKFIIVYVDGRCRPGGSIPLTGGGDRCERGTFYLDTPQQGSTAKMETLMLELMDYIDKNYRTKAPADIDVTYY